MHQRDGVFNTAVTVINAFGRLDLEGFMIATDCIGSALMGYTQFKLPPRTGVESPWACFLRPRMRFCT